MPCTRSARCSGGTPSSSSCLQGLPSSRLVIPCALSTRCFTGVPPLPLGLSRAPLARVVRPLTPFILGLGSSPYPGGACHVLGAYAVVQGGSPLRPGSACAPWAPAVRPPPPPACARFARVAGAGGPCPRPVPRLPGGVLRWSAQWLPPLSPLRASGARCWVGGSPPPPPPPRPLALGAGCRSGGPIVTVCPVSVPRVIRAFWGPLSGSRSPPCGGFSCWDSRGSPPALSLRTMGARCWVRVPPLPSYSRRLLALCTHHRSGGPLSSVSLSAGPLSSHALLGVLSFPSSSCIFPLPVSPWPSLSGVGLVVTGPPTDAAGVAPVKCAGVYPAPPVLSSISISSPWPSSSSTGPALTGPPANAAVAAPVDYAVGYPAPPALSSLSPPLRTIFPSRPVALRCPHHRVGALWWVSRWVVVNCRLRLGLAPICHRSWAHKDTVNVVAVLVLDVCIWRVVFRCILASKFLTICLFFCNSILK